MISSEELAELLAANHEQRNVEFKAAGSMKDKHLFARVA
ncbi:MAG: hypothetical protein JWP48_5387 [Actinoallomurus sp.]|jgi:hypothetical protein|nr:hypothetical protein [Actinoallomurus sp.]